MVTSKEAALKRRGRFFAYAPLVLWIAVILILGSGPGASAQTSRFIGPLIAFFFPDASPDTFLIVHALIRKTAHFVEYFILSLLALRAFSPTANVVRRHRYMSALSLVLAVAAVDEAKQSINPARAGSAWDFLLDLAGGIAALTAYHLNHRRRGKRSFGSEAKS